MFKKRRSMLGRRHLAVQQTKQSTAPPSSDPSPAPNISGERREQANNSRSGRSAKKRIPYQIEKGSKDFKKCLFTKSPALSLGNYRMQSQDASYNPPNDTFLDETGFANIAPTPKTTPRTAITPASLQQRRVQLQSHRYGAVTAAANKEIRPTTSSNLRLIANESSYVCDFDNLKPPDFPGPSRLERLLQEEESTQTSSGFNVDNLEPPKLPDCSRLDRIIMSEKLKPPLDIELGKMTSLNIADKNPMPFSPPLSSTCIGSPDSEKKTLTDGAKETAASAGKKLSTIIEDYDVSVIEFELNERTVTELDHTSLDATMNNTVRPNNVTHSETVLEDVLNTNESDPSWENVLSHLDNIEQAAMNRAIALQKMQNDCQQEISSIRSLKKTLESFKQSNAAKSSIENKENCDFKVPTYNKLKESEMKWFNSVKKENPRLLKTPVANRKVTQTSSWTPHSLSKALCDQMSQLYDS